MIKLGSLGLVGLKAAPAVCFAGPVIRQSWRFSPVERSPLVCNGINNQSRMGACGLCCFWKVKGPNTSCSCQSGVGGLILKSWCFIIRDVPWASAGHTMPWNLIKWPILGSYMGNGVRFRRKCAAAAASYANSRGAIGPDPTCLYEELCLYEGGCPCLPVRTWGPVLPPHTAQVRQLCLFSF